MFIKNGRITVENELVEFPKLYLEFTIVAIAVKIRQHKWIEKFIKGYNFTFEHYPGKANAFTILLSQKTRRIVVSLKIRD